jgi:hypothetical protein
MCRAFGARSSIQSADCWFIGYRRRRAKETRLSAANKILMNQISPGFLSVLVVKIRAGIRLRLLLCRDK